MSDIAMNATDHDTIRLLDALMHKAGVSAPDLAELWGCDPSTVYRIARGESVPSAPALKRLAQARPKTAGHILEYFRRGADWLTFQVIAEPATQIDRDLIRALHQTADFMEQRRKDLADGEISADERDKEVATLDGLIGRLHELRAGVKDQAITTRRKCHEQTVNRVLGLAQEGGAA